MATGEEDDALGDIEAQRAEGGVLELVLLLLDLAELGVEVLELGQGAAAAAAAAAATAAVRAAAGGRLLLLAAATASIAPTVHTASIAPCR